MLECTFIGLCLLLLKTTTVHDDSMAPAPLSHSYSSVELLAINSTISIDTVKLPTETWNTLKVLKLCNPQPTHRGTKGSKKHRHIPVFYGRRPVNCKHRQVNHNNLTTVQRSGLPQRSSKDLHIALVNPCSVRNKTADICEHVVSSSIDICLFTETWLKGRDSVVRAELKPEGYNFKDNPRPSGRNGGGLGIMFRNGIKCKTISAGGKSSFEYANYSVMYENTKLDIHVVYRPPFSSKHPVTTATFFEEFQSYLSDIVKSPLPLYIAGDFNIHVDLPSDRDALKLSKLLQMYDLIQHVTFPTHRSGHSLDLVITRNCHDLLVTHTASEYMISDHIFVHTHVNFPRPALRLSTVTYRKLKEVDHRALSADFCEMTSNLMNITDIDQLAKVYNTELRSVLDKHAPIVSKTIVERQRLPWFDSELCDLKTSRRRAEDLWRKNKDPGSLVAFHQARNKYVHALHSKRTVYLSSLISDAGQDCKKLFNIVNTLCDKKHDNPLPEHDSLESLVSVFGFFFKDKIDKIDADMGATQPPIIPKRSGVSGNLLSYEAVTQEEVRKLVSFAKTTSCPADPIPTKLLKEHLDDLLPLLTHIINCSLSSGVFPQEWKTARVVPLLKKPGADLVLQNYRPVSNLQFVSKLVERAVAKQLRLHCDSSYPLPTLQSAYRAGFSTETALLKVQSDILLNMDSQKVTQLVLIDLSAAFDTVNHSLLLNIMQDSFGVEDTALHWFASYLDSRSQCISIDGTTSKPLPLDKGVPQGSCLGPVLFTEYASPVFEVIHQCEKDAHGYADDHQVYSAFDPKSLVPALESMEHCIMNIRDWMHKMRLKMNDSKTEFILIGTPQQLAKCATKSISIGNCSIEASEYVRNLGAYFDRNMNMEEHISRKCRAAYAQLYNISKIRVYLDDASAEQLIHALVHSHIDYCNSLLSGLPKYLVRKLQMVQNSAARVLCGLSKHDSITPALKSLHWLPVLYRIKFKVCLITFSALQGLGPQYLKDMLSVRESRTRSGDSVTLMVPRTKHTTLGDRAYAVAGPSEWNKLPCHVRNITDINLFKSKLKAHFFSIAFKD